MPTRDEHASEPVDDRVLGGIDRRTLIRRAAIAGAAAWTAPVILGSVASPAGAATYTGCYRVQFELAIPGTRTTCSSFTRVVPDNGAGCLDPSTWNNLPDFPGTVTITAEKISDGANASTPALCDFFITLESDSNCALDERSVARKDQGNNCAVGIAGAGCQSITIRPIFIPDRFKILIGCDDVICPGGSACSA